MQSAALPSAPLIHLERGPVLQPPLSRCGRGPGLLLVRPSSDCQHNNSSLDPEPIQKWAEESYAVVQITQGRKQDGPGIWSLFGIGIEALASLQACDNKSQCALLIYGSKNDYEPGFEVFLKVALTYYDNIAAAVYLDAWDTPSNIPVLLHTSNSGVDTPPGWTRYVYPEASSPGFMVPGHPDFQINSAAVAHTRSLNFLKKHLNGPYFDLEKIWDEHTYYEFGERSVEKTMATMVQEPYVNHIPTMTGGVGRERLSNFYLNHFIFNNPDDTSLELVSRTVGVDRVVDEFIFCFTHNKEVDWLIPGIPPTGRHLRIPFTSVVNIRGDRLYHEHIAWDQATVLVQLGLMPEYLPFPYPLPGGKTPAAGKRFEYRVPASGADTAAKLQNEHLVPSNSMLGFSIREVDDN